MLTEEKMIEHTQNWIKSVVIDCNFCPFAAKPFLNKTIHYTVLSPVTEAGVIEALLTECGRMDEHIDIETVFIILPVGVEDFHAYLALVEMAEEVLGDDGYEGIYQIASFHPDYCFDDAEPDDPANFTNRSIYPMLHILRENSITNALAFFPDADKIPERNIHFAHQKGLLYMQALRASCII